jgi:AAA+ superfamily predicted ATPase
MSDDWNSGNERVLAADLARLKAQISGLDVSQAVAQAAEARAQAAAPAAIDLLTRYFNLSQFERDVLLLCAGIELDATLVPGLPAITVHWARAHLTDPHWSAFSPVGPLRLWRLVELRDESALGTSALAIDERVLHFLAGVNYVDSRLRPLLRASQQAGAILPGHAEVADALLATLQGASAPTPVVQLIGDDTAGHEEVATRIAAAAGLGLHKLRSEDIPTSPAESDALAMLWHREAALLRSALLLQVDATSAAPAARFAERTGGLLFTSSPHPLAIDRAHVLGRIDQPGSAEQRAMWSNALGDRAEGISYSLDAIAAQFRFDTDTISRIARSIPQGASNDTALDDRLWLQCREHTRGRLDNLAKRVEPAARWDDLVLPEQAMATLQEISAHLRQRMKVYEEWGFAGTTSRGLGVSVLFSGESGTGKTMAAEVLARELRLDLYRIDLAGLVSKYVGETEKNLRRVFDAAENSGAILLFDEADALFGKRSDAKDSSDRYANLEVSYLLQRMEEYRGLAILTTNLKSTLDPAFMRRLRFVIQFPFPDAKLRERIWRGAFPAGVPLDDVDPVKLAQLNVAGGNIRNIALNAAFLAADREVPVGMAHLLRAARSEATKRDRPFSDAETRGWV